MSWHTDEYAGFLARKRILAEPSGFSVPSSSISSLLFPFQKQALNYDLEHGKAANFLHTGLGKGPIQMNWCAHVSEHAKGDTLIAAPLAVSQQFKRESVKFGIDMTVCETQEDVRPGVNVTNYERLKHFDLSRFVGIALDESSCIKDWTSKTTLDLTARLANTPYKLCSSATPSPNDHAELGTHSELLDAMRRAAMLAMFFEHDGGETAAWTLKGHGRRKFFEFVSSFAIAARKPSDMGFDDTGYDLPPLNLQEHVVSVDQSIATEGMLFRRPDFSATGLHKEMRLTAEDRAKHTADIVRANPNEQWIIWCNTDYEADALKRYLPGAFEVRGPDSPKKKEQAIEDFVSGNIKWLLSKTAIFGFGLNLQNCWNMAFVGLSYSFESMFQALRRCWRFGQTHEVNAHLVRAETEGPVMQSLRAKEAQYEELQDQMVAAMRDIQIARRYRPANYDHTMEMKLPAWL
jgi:hypothetical protein